MRIEKTYTPISEPSPWWLKGLAIFMLILAIFYALNALLSAATIELSIFQNSGYATTINEIYATITLTGTCISCTGNSTIDNIVETYVIKDMTPTNSHPFFYSPEYSTFGISQCEYSLEDSFTDEGFMFGPGLECEHQIRLQIDYTGLDSNYDYTWSDWTYYLLWSMTPVEMN